ncbi:MAG: hypothetical protein ABSF21_03390 [Dehalococcoidia bacterium]
MTRGIKRRTWVKLDCQGVLHGSINWLFNLEEQAVFLKLIPMAAVYCKTPGTIADNEGKPLSREFIAYELHCPVETLNSVIDKGTKDNCLKDTEQGLVLVNFPLYQFTEYDRQKPWRERQRQKGAKGEIDPSKYTGGKYGHMVHTGSHNPRDLPKEYTPTPDYPDLEGEKDISQ